MYSKRVSAKITKMPERIENEQPSATESFFPADKQEKPVTQLTWIPWYLCALRKGVFHVFLKSAYLVFYAKINYMTLL